MIGVSILSGAHMSVFPRTLALLRERGVGVIPDEDAAELKRIGVAEIADQDATPDEVVATVRRLVDEERVATIR